MKLYLFDFDGTLTSKDTLFEFIKFAKGPAAFYGGFLIVSPAMVLSKLGVISTGRAKELFLKFFFNGYSRERLEELGRNFLTQKLDDLVKPSAREYLDRIKKEGHDVCIVSASLDFWLEPFCEKNQIKLICTKAEYKNGIYTGKFLGENCKGKEKARLINEQYDLSKYDEILAFGDSSGDIEMLALAHQKHYRYFK